MKDQSVSRLWDNYIDKTNSYQIKSTATCWHVWHAEDSIKAHSDSRLSQQSAVQVGEYPGEKAEPPTRKTGNSGN